MNTNPYHILTLLIISYPTLWGMENKNINIDINISGNGTVQQTAVKSLKKLCSQQVQPSQILGLKDHYEKNINLDEFDTIESWPAEYVKKHKDNILDLLLAGIQSGDEWEKNHATAKKILERVMQLDNTHVKSYILTKLLVQEQTVKERKISACDLHPFYLFELGKLMNISINHALEQEDALPLFYEKYFDNNLKKLFLRPTTWCMSYTPDCCKSRVSTTNRDLLKEKLKLESTTGSYTELNDYLTKTSANMCNTISNEIGHQDDYCENDWKYFVFSIERKFAKAFAETLLLILLNQKENTETHLNFAQQILNLINRQVTKAEIDGFLKSFYPFNVNFLGVPLENIPAWKMGYLKDNININENTKGICDIKGIIIKVLNNFMLNSRFDSKNKLLEFIDELKEYRKEHCTLPTIQKEKYLSLLDQLYKIIE